MALNRQIHLYSLDTSCFYTDDEMVFHKRLSRLYSIRKAIKDKLEKFNKRIKNITENKNEKNEDCNDHIILNEVNKLNEKIDIFTEALRRVNKLIKKNKERMIKEFTRFKTLDKTRCLREECLEDKNIQSMFESSLSRVLHIPINTITDNIMIVQVYYFEPAEDILKHGFYYNNEKIEFMYISYNVG